MRLCGDCQHLIITGRPSEYGKEVRDNWCSAIAFDTNRPGEWLGFRDRRLDICDEQLKNRNDPLEEMFLDLSEPGTRASKPSQKTLF